jgi:hypothetical protein
MVFAWTTATFALIDYGQARLKFTATWDPRTLPRVQPHASWTSRFNSLAELIFTVIALAWLLLIPGSPALLLGPAAGTVALTPVWGLAYPAMIGIALATIAIGFVNFLWPYWTPARSMTRIAIHTTTFAMFSFLLYSGPWLTARAGAALSVGPSMDRFIGALNSYCQIGLAFASVVALFEIVREALRWRSRRGSSLGSGAPVLR